MPLKDGKLTKSEQAFSREFAATGDAKYAAKQAGYGSPQPRSSELLQKPAIQAEIGRIQLEKLFSEILPLAVRVHAEILADPKAPAGARVQAVKLAYDRTLGAQDGAQAKEPHEMTAEEIADAIGKLETIAMERAKMVDIAPTMRHDDDMFS